MKNKQGEIMSREITLGRKIQALRKQIGYTQFQLAELIGIHPNYISQIERCEKEPSMKKLCQIKELLHASWEELLDPEIVLPNAPERRNKTKESNQKKIIKFLDGLDTNQTKLVLNVVKEITKGK